MIITHHDILMYPASLANLFHVPASYATSFEFTHIKMCLKETYDTSTTPEHSLVEAIKRGIVAYLLLDTVEYVQDNGKGSLKFHSDGEMLVTKGWSSQIPLSDTRPREIIIDYASHLLHLKRKPVEDDDSYGDSVEEDVEYEEDLEWQWRLHEEESDEYDDESEGDPEVYDASEEVAPEVKAEMERSILKPGPTTNIKLNDLLKKYGVDLDVTSPIEVEVPKEQVVKKTVAKKTVKVKRR